MKRVVTAALFVLAVGGAFAQETAPAWKDDIPIVPTVRWNELNWLQKCTAGVACVPGCVLGLLANGCYWVYGVCGGK